MSAILSRSRYVNHETTVKLQSPTGLFLYQIATMATLLQYKFEFLLVEY